MAIDVNKSVSSNPTVNSLNNMNVSGTQKDVANSSSKSGSVKKSHKKSIGFMHQWFRQYYKQVTLLACVIVLVLSYVFVLSGKFSQARSVSNMQFKDISQTRSILEEQLGYLSKLELDKELVSTVDIGQIDKLLPKDPATPQIFTSLEGIAHASGVTIDSINIVLNNEGINESTVTNLKDILPEGVFGVGVNMSVKNSSYDGFKLFLSTLEKNIRLMDVIAVDYSPNGKNYNIALRAYYLPNFKEL